MFFAPGAAVDRRDAAARAPARPRARLGRRARRRRPRPHAARVPARQRRPARRARSTAACSSSGCCSPSASTSGIFTATYDQQANVDAQLTLGADVTATAPPGRHRRPRPRRRKIAAVPGVQGTTAVDHSYAYVGPDLQDTYGIDPARSRARRRCATPTSSAQAPQQTLARLRATRRRDPRLQGDDHRLPAEHRRPAQPARARPRDRPLPRRAVPRRRDRAGVPLGAHGLVHGRQPAVPRRRPTTPAGPTSSSSRPATRRHRRAPSRGPPRADGTIVKNIDQQTQQTVSSITTVDLRGISHIEEAFTIALAAAAMALFVALDHDRAPARVRDHGRGRRHACAASARSSGARPRSSWPPALLLAAGLGVLLALMLVAMLQHVFDPPPDHLAIPWAYLGELAGAALDRHRVRRRDHGHGGSRSCPSVASCASNSTVQMTARRHALDDALHAARTRRRAHPRRARTTAADHRARHAHPDAHRRDEPSRVQEAAGEWAITERGRRTLHQPNRGASSRAQFE